MVCRCFPEDPDIPTWDPGTKAGGAADAADVSALGHGACQEDGEWRAWPLPRVWDLRVSKMDRR